MFLKYDSSWCEGVPGTNLLSEMRADVLLVLAVSVELQLLLVGMSRLLQGDMGSGQQLFLVPLPLLGHHSQLRLGEALPVPHAFMLHLEEQHVRRRQLFAHGMGWHKDITGCLDWSSVLIILISTEQKSSPYAKIDRWILCKIEVLRPRRQHCFIIHSVAPNWWHANRNPQTPLHDKLSIIMAAGPWGKLCVTSSSAGV